MLGSVDSGGGLRVYDRAGGRLATIEFGGSTVVAIAATHSEDRMIAVELNRAIVLIDVRTWTILDRWTGQWQDAAVSPDGSFVVGLEPWGRLHCACIRDDRFAPLGEVAMDIKAAAVALGEDDIAVVGGGEVHRATLSINCTGSSKD